MNKSVMRVCFGVLLLASAPRPATAGPPRASNPSDGSVQAAVAVDTSGQLIFLYTANGGTTWENQVLQLPYGYDRCASPAVVIDYKGTVAVMFEAWNGNDRFSKKKLYMTKGDGRKFNMPSSISAYLEDSLTSPQLSIDTGNSFNRGNVYAVWLVTRATGDMDIQFARSKQQSGADELQPPDQLNFYTHTDVTNVTLNVDYQGNITVAWNEPNPYGSSARFIHVSRTSNNGGASFTQELRIAY